MYALLETASKGWFVFIQILTIPANFCISRLLRLRIVKPKDLTLKPGTLIIANHQSKIDPFLVSYHLRIRSWTIMLPIRYPVDPEFMKRPILGFCIRLLGGYSIGETSMERAKKLLFTRQLLDDGYSIVIFPEGKIVRDSDFVEQFQKGAHMLFADPRPVVFVRLSGLNEKHKFHFWRGGTHPVLSYSSVIDAADSTEEKVKRMTDFYRSSHTNPSA